MSNSDDKFDQAYWNSNALGGGIDGSWRTKCEGAGGDVIFGGHGVT